MKTSTKYAIQAAVLAVILGLLIVTAIDILYLKHNFTGGY